MRGTPFLKQEWTGGLNTIDSPYTLAENESRDCLNVVSTERGSIRKRYGSTQFTITPPNIEFDSMAEVTFPGNVKYTVLAGAGKIYASNTGGGLTEIGKGFTAGARWSIVQAPKTTGVASEGPVYLVNGVDAPQFWNGGAEVKEWKGIASSPKLTDGIGQKGAVYFKSATAKFISGDIGLLIKFETAVKVAGTEIKEALIETVISPTEVALAINEAGWEAEYTAVHFSIERAYYEKTEHVPNGQFMVFFGNRIWMTGIKEDPSAVWFSELVSIGEGGAQADPSSWPTSNVVRFDASDGKEITGIGTVGPYLCLFKEKKTWVIHDINTGANRRLADTVGCVAHRSIVETTGGTFFLTADQGVYLTDGAKLHEMSYNIRPTILGINPAQRQNAAGAYFNNHYYLSFASGTSATPNRTVDYDAQLKSWWLHDLAGNQWELWESTAGLPKLYTLPPEAKVGMVQAFVEGVYTDREKVYAGNGTLAAYFLSNWEPFSYFIFRHRIKAPMIKKRVRALFFNGEGSIVTTVYRDFLQGGRQEPGTVGNNPQYAPELPVKFNAGEEKWGEGSGKWGEHVEGTEEIWGGEVTVGAARLYSLGVGFVWSFGFGNNSSEPFIVDAAVWMIQFRKS